MFLVVDVSVFFAVSVWKLCIHDQTEYDHNISFNNEFLEEQMTYVLLMTRTA
jgi:hypothetical protein